MRKKVAALGAALMVVLATAAAALAITNGTPDGNRHPFVGLMVALDSDGVPLWRCSAGISVSRYADLPDPGLVDTLANKTPVDFVGYGVQFQANVPGNQLPQPPPFYRWTGLKQRMYAPSELVSSTGSTPSSPRTICSEGALPASPPLQRRVTIVGPKWAQG